MSTKEKFTEELARKYTIAGRTFTTTLAREGAKFVLGMFGLGGRR